MSTELMTIERLAPQAGVNWETAQRFVAAAKRFEHGAVACRVMAGLVLIELKKVLGISQGSRSDLNLRHDAGSWEETVIAKLGVSEKTARRWMEMAEAARARLVADDVAGVFRQLLEIPLSRLTDDQAKALSSGVEALVDGRSQLDFMESLGLLAPPPAKGGDKEWEAFLRAKHPELIKNGKIPPRGKVGKQSKAVLEEFSKWMEAKSKPRTPAQIREAALALVWEIENVLGAAVRNKVLAVLEPADLVGLESVTSLWNERLKRLKARN